jgi:hypothetical protein
MTHGARQLLVTEGGLMPADGGGQQNRKARRTAVDRARLRAQGLRPIRIWVPDVHAPGFAQEARRQSRLAAESPHAGEDQAFVDAVSTIEL